MLKLNTFFEQAIIGKKYDMKTLTKHKMRHSRKWTYFIDNDKGK